MRKSVPCVAFECVGLPGILGQIMAGSPKHVRIISVGCCMTTDPIEPLIGCAKEAMIQFVLGYTPEEFAASLALIAEGQIPYDALVTRQVSRAELPDAISSLIESPDEGKLILRHT